MIALVTGGAASGKSAYAEQLACDLSPVRTYLATMAPGGEEAQTRIDRHRAQRAGGHFATIERTGTLLGEAPTPQAASGVLLLDDVGNLVSNALFGADGSVADAGMVLDRLDAEFAQLAGAYAHVVVVGNEVGSDGVFFTDENGTWVRLVGSLCCRIAARSDMVVEVVAGVPYAAKGTLR
ncbi:MAG: bifunctional adenosylcobinamide kinase/adenosylcobinamide-phosphate guanylyltransferase [Eggerthellaceae bacterium]|nr:bifunctional adenosylcobinamide kinase/adenosylcobinamide-phosphate guanylyltransferase [Eggerthellaceae bacterium]